MKTRKWCCSWIAFLLILAMLPITAFATGTDGAEPAAPATVTVYLSMSHDAAFLQPTATDAVMALRKLEVPYFDLGLYGLENFYFSSENYGDDGDGEPGSALQPGTQEFAKDKITMMHLFIYATEVFYCGIRPEDAGKGGLKTMLGSEIMNITGSVGSSYLSNFWGMDENLNYYLNYQYPLASPGWGATSDQILLEDGDIVTLGHFSDWNFYKDPTSVFNYIKAGEDTVTTTAVQGEQVSMTAYRAGANMGAPGGGGSQNQGDYTTAHTPLTSCPAVYYVAVEDLSSGDVEDPEAWTLLTTADDNGSFTVDTSKMEPGEYLVCIPGQYGVRETLKEPMICSTPGGIILTVEEPQIMYGDVNGDGKVNSTDAALTYAVHNGKRSFTQAQQQAADVNGDGKINSTDAALIYAVHNGKRQTFPIEAS